MNYMGSKESNLSLRELSLSIGDFIRYWGFRRIHGAIWTQIYLSKTPLSGADLTRRLKLSKALVNPALIELKKWGLIKSAKSNDEKTKLFKAEENVNDVIKHVLKIREQKLIKVIESKYNAVNDLDYELLDIDAEKLKQLGNMVVSAQLMLNLMLATDDFIELPTLLDSLNN